MPTSLRFCRITNGDPRTGRVERRVERRGEEPHLHFAPIALTAGDDPGVDRGPGSDLGVH
jgi:hypothetical protein